MGLKVVLLTSGQPSANPRLVKEAIALAHEGLSVSVIYCPLCPWADPYDEELFARYPQIRWIRVGSHPEKNRLGYGLARIRRKFYEFIFKGIGNRLNAAEWALVLYSQELNVAACKMKADMYIGHNLGALPATVNAAQKHVAKAVFDFEDYHRGEHLPNSIQTRMVEAVEEKYVKHLSYATTAAPLITEVYKNLFPFLSLHTVNNCFPKAYAPDSLPVLKKSPLRLFWFSQFIGEQRGLEQVIAAMGKTGMKEIQLTLLGNCSDKMKQYLLKEAKKYQLDTDQLEFIPPVCEKEIVHIASQHHIGLAVEIPHNQNRQVCLTNKIFMYLLAGNAIIFSNTKAQAQFFQQYKGIGSIFINEDIDALAAILVSYYNDLSLLQTQRDSSFALAQELNWEQEKNKIVSLIYQFVAKFSLETTV